MGTVRISAMQTVVREGCPPETGQWGKKVKIACHGQNRRGVGQSGVGMRAIDKIVRMAQAKA